MFWFMRLYGQVIYNALNDSMTYWLETAPSGNVSTGVWSVTEGELLGVFVEVIKTVAIAAGPMLILSILVSVIVTGVQTKFVFSSEALKPTLSKMNPLNGFKKFFSLRSVVELLKSLLKTAVIIVVIYNKIKDEIPNLAKLFDMEVSSALVYLCSTVFDIIISVCIAFFFIAAADYLYQRWQYTKDLRMTKQEVKEEYKQTEGDPKIKGKIKQKQQQMAMARMMQEVPKADVIIRNPTHFAVAIRYDREKDLAPVVIAKGQDNIAMKIIEIATEHNIAMKEDRPLARALYDEVELGKIIPPVFYEEVAAVLAWVYQLEGKVLSD